ncbi:MAG: peptidase domain-containing ABC transporter [Spirochaetales bacterium]|nr:peptidase domain-containing ABC transporter [Spirochaetales bacterium]
MVILPRRYYCIKQHDITDCGAACLATVARQYGLKKPISRIREVAGTDRMGTNALGLVKAAKTLGFIAKGVKGSLDQIDGNIPLPAIAHVVQENLFHYVVIHRITKKNILVADPGKGLVRYTPEDFGKVWSGVLILLLPEESFEKKDETTGMLSRFFSLMIPHKSLIGEIFLSSVLFTLLGILGAFYFKFLIDEVFEGGLVKSLNIISVGMVILTLFKVLMDAFRKHLLLHLSQKIDVSLIFSYYQHVLKLPMSFFDRRKVGEILSRLNDASKIRAAISGATLSILIDTLMVIGGGIILFIQNRQLFLIALLFIPFSVAVVWSFTRPFQRIQRKLMSEAAITESYLVETLNGVSTVKAMNAESEVVRETERKFIRTLKSGFTIGWMTNLQFSLQDFLTLLGGIVILWTGAHMVLGGSMSLGQLITFNALLAYFHQPIRSLINLQPVLQEAFIAADRLGEILDLQDESKNEKTMLQPKSVCGHICFKNINFRYGTRQRVLNNINLTINPGKRYAIVGESGSGKTTLIKLLLKYYIQEEGEILIDWNNHKDIATDYLRGRIGYVPQDVFIFSGTIMENIALGEGSVDFERIVKAAKASKAHDFINELPLRYNTMVGERGVTLSGGQKQRIAIARALLKEPDILIFDEATSNCDSITEKSIHATIDEMTRDKTTIIIAHRFSTIMQCDRIICMANGMVAETGTHRELLQKKGIYFKLWEEQFSYTSAIEEGVA